MPMDITVYQIIKEGMDVQKNEGQSENQLNKDQPSHSISGQNNGTIFNNITQTFKKRPLFSILAVVGIFVMSIFMVSFLTSSGESNADEAIRKFENAIATENVSELKELISVDDSDMEIQDEYLTQFIRYVKDNPKYLQEILRVMYAQKALYENEAHSNPDLFKSSPNEILQSGEYYLKHKKGFFSDSYSIGVRPKYLNIILLNQNGVIKVDGKEVLKISKGKNSIKLGPLFPGEYQVQYEVYFDYANKTITEDESVNLFGNESVTEVSKYVTGETVPIRSALKGVQVYLNDKPTPIMLPNQPRISSVERDYFFPAVKEKDGTQTIQGVVKFPWGESRSEKFVVGDKDGVLNLEPPLTEEAKTGAESVIRPFLESRLHAWVNKDINQAKNIMPVAKEQLSKQIEKQMFEKFASNHKGIQSIKLTDYTLDDYWANWGINTHGQYNVEHSEKSKTYVIQMYVKVHYELLGNDGYQSNGEEKLDLWVTYDNGEWKVAEYYGYGL